MKIRYILLLVLFVFLIFIVKTCYDAGAFKSIEPHSPGEVITMYTSVAGTEDIDIDRDKGFLFISSTDRRNKGSNNDGIYLLDLNTSSNQPRKLITTFNGAFHPHGISVFKEDSMLYLHAVNHNDKGDFIEIFEYRNDILVHMLSVSSDIMCCPNDVVAVGKFKCYITNDHGSPSGIRRTMEDYLKIPRSYILYYNGSSFKKVYEGLNYANGINVSPNHMYLYTTHTTGKEMLTFDLDKTAETISLNSVISLDTGVDNIDVDEKGNIWIGCHPKLFDFMGHAKDASSVSPSQILRLKPGKSVHTNYEVEEIFLDDGNVISGSSVGVQYNNELFIGVVFDKKLMRLKL